MDEKKFRLVYIVGLIVTTIIMIWIIAFGQTSLHFTFVIFFWIVKYLSGFGLILSISNGFLIIMDKRKEKLSKKGVNALVIFQIIIPILLIIYSIYKIFQSYAESTATPSVIIWDVNNWFDNVIYIYGILSLLLNLYIIPIIRDEFEEAVELGKLKFWKKGAQRVARGIKKRYFRLKKDYAKAQIQDQMTVKEILDLWRNKFAVNLLLVTTVGTFIFTPISFICIMYWLRLYVFFRSETNKYENIALLASMIWIGFIATVSPYVNLGIYSYSSISQYLWTMNIFYLIGILFATLIFVKKLLNLQGITIAALKLKRKSSQIDKLKKEKEDLKKQLKAQKKEPPKKANSTDSSLSKKDKKALEKQIQKGADTLAKKEK